MNNYKKLEVWRDSVDLVTEVYKLCKKFPHDEKYGLTSQVKRSAVSIASNIAEGAGRSTKKDFANFLHYAIASSYELYHFYFRNARKKMKYIVLLQGMKVEHSHSYVITFMKK